MAFASYVRPLASMMQDNYWNPQATAAGPAPGAPAGSIYDLPTGGAPVTGPLPPVAAPPAGGGNAPGGPSDAPPGAGAGFPAFGTHGGSRPIGSPNVPGEMKGIYTGGMPRMNVPIDPRTGRPAVGAADVLASLSASGWKPANDPNWGGFSFDQATQMKADAMAQMKAAYEGGTMSTWDRMFYEDLMSRGPGQGRFADALYNPETGYDQNGNYVGLFGEGGGYDQYGRDAQDQIQASYGIGPMPRVAGALDATPTQGDWQAYQDWYSTIFPGEVADPIYSGQDPWTTPDMSGSTMGAPLPVRRR